MGSVNTNQLFTHKPIEHIKLKKELEMFNIELEKFVQELINHEDKAYKNFSRKKYPNIFRVYKKHKGLCDLICNYFTLVKPDNLDKLNEVNNLIAHFKQDNKFDFKKMEQLSKTHVVSLVGFIELLKFVLFKIVPDSILTISEQRKLRSKENGINRELLNNKFNKLSLGKCIKFTGFSTKILGLLPNTGHSMLLCKIGKDDFIFFNPDQYKPECTFYNSNDLLVQLDKISKSYERISFIDNDKFMKRVNQKLFRNNMNRKKPDTNQNLEELNYQPTGVP